MKRILSLCLLFSTTSVVMAEPLTRVWSRSIMPSCEFVYQVESDVKIKVPVEVIQEELSARPHHELYVRAVFKNSWGNAPYKSEVFMMKVDREGIAKLTFESMSVSRGFLFRQMFFQIGVKVDTGAFYALSTAYSSDVGREFGEACSTIRFDDAQYVERAINH